MQRTGRGRPAAGAWDVLVVGYGPVGAVLAARLAALGRRTLVVERETVPYPLPRAVAADDEVAALLDRTAPGLLDGAVTAPEVRFLDRTGRPLGALRFPPGPTGHPGLSLFDQPALEQRLRQHVASREEVEVRLGVALLGFTQDPAGVTARLSDGTQVRAGWLVGCDGASSTVRRGAGIAWRGRDLPRPWLVVDVAGAVPERPGFTYTGDPDLPRVDMPVPGGHRWEWLVPGAAERAADHGAVRALLARDVDPDRVTVRRAVAYRFAARRAATWQVGRVLLAGDAAHTMPPFAGQGLGAGVRDAYLLAARLAAGDPSGYPRERSGHVREMTRLSLAVGAVLQTGSRPVATARDTLLRAGFAAPGLGPWLARGGPRRTRSGVLELD